MKHVNGASEDYDVKEIKDFAYRNMGDDIPEEKRVSIIANGINVTNPWLDESARFALSDEEARKTWGSENVEAFIDKVNAVLSKVDKSQWLWEVAENGDYLRQDDESFGLRVYARSLSIMRAAKELGISKEILREKDYIAELDEDKFVDMVNAKEYLREWAEENNIATGNE